MSHLSLGKWCYVNEIGDTGKTKIFEVRTKAEPAENTMPLGVIKWYSAWRQYAFFPRSATLFEPTCLNDISKFMKNLTVEKKRSRESKSMMARHPPAPDQSVAPSDRLLGDGETTGDKK